jgi:hypothetical protein
MQGVSVAKNQSGGEGVKARQKRYKTGAKTEQKKIAERKHKGTTKQIQKAYCSVRKSIAERGRSVFLC